MTRRKSEKKRGRRYQFEFSGVSLVFWSFCLFFLMGWLFVLGILVGRGFLPEGVRSISELKEQIARLQGMVNLDKSSGMDILKDLDKDPEFAFFDKLSTKREEAATQSSPNVEKKKDIQKPAKRAEPNEAQAPYTLQVASLENRKKAEAMVSRLVDRGYQAYLHEVTIKGKRYYRVRCGRFDNEKAAGDYGRLLAKKLGIVGFVSRTEE
jgi:DedD protein